MPSITFMQFHSASASSVYIITALAYLIVGRQAAQNYIYFLKFKSKAYSFVQDSRFLSVVETSKVQVNFLCFPAKQGSLSHRIIASQKN